MKNCILISLVLTMAAAFSAYAGSLTPPGAPAPSMKSLDQVPPTWDQLLSSTDGRADGCNSSRFKCVMNDNAVLDRETGLVWERTPQAWVPVAPASFLAAGDRCIRQMISRTGWRVPSIQELQSLSYYPATNGIYLPPGNPFTIDAVKGVFWSSTTDAQDSSSAWTVNIRATPLVGVVGKGNATGVYVWCVRSGSGESVQ